MELDDGETILNLQPIIRGIQVNSALYLTMAFVAGLVSGHPLAWKLALAAIGVTYLSYTLQMPKLVAEYPNDPTPRVVYFRFQRAIAQFMVIWSIALGAAAGIALLF